MGRLRAAIEAGQKAVAVREATMSDAQALLAIGLDEPELLAIAKAASTERGRLVLVADQLPADLVSEATLVFEYLPTLAELLVAAPPTEASEHRLRRLSFILGRWSITECLWIGGEAEDLVRLALARTGPDRPGVAFRHHAGRTPSTRNRV